MRVKITRGKRGRMRAAWVVMIVFAAACDRSVAGGSTDGAAVFARACATCHGPKGEPDPSKIGVRNLTTPEFHARATVELVEKQVRNGSANHGMPSFDGALT